MVVLPNVDRQFDEKTGHEWYIVAAGDMDWYEFKSWVSKLDFSGEGWGMPSVSNLKSLYKSGESSRRLAHLFKKSRWWVWTGQVYDPGDHTYTVFNFKNGTWEGRVLSFKAQVLAVRKRK